MKRGARCSVSGRPFVSCKMCYRHVTVRLEEIEDIQLGLLRIRKAWYYARSSHRNAHQPRPSCGTVRWDPPIQIHRIRVISLNLFTRIEPWSSRFLGRVLLPSGRRTEMSASWSDILSVSTNSGPPCWMTIVRHLALTLLFSARYGRR